MILNPFLHLGRITQGDRDRQILGATKENPSIRGPGATGKRLPLRCSYDKYSGTSNAGCYDERIEQ
jgi:hypothetical protein